MSTSKSSAIDLAGRWLLLLLLVAYTFYNLGPIFWLIISSLKSRVDLFSMPPKLVFTPDFSGYQSVFGVGAAAGSASAVGVFDSLVNSVLVSTVGTFLAVFLGTLAGYVCSRFNFRGKGDFMFFVLSTRMLPPVAVLVFYHLMFARLGLADTRTGLILVAIFANVGLATWIMKGFFDGVPREVEQIAIVNGYSRMYAFTRLVLPMVKGGIAASAGFCFIFAWNEFAFASILTTTQAKTLPVKISSAAGATGIEWTQICAAGVVLIIPVLVFFYLIRKHLLMGMTFGVLGRRSDKTAFAVLPGAVGRDGKFRRQFSVGGQGMGINKYSKKLPELTKFMEWYFQPDQQKRYAAVCQTGLKAVLESPDWQGLNSYNRQFSTALAYLNDYWHLPEYPALLDELQQEVSNAVAGSKTVQQALSDAAEKNERTLERAGYEIKRGEKTPEVPDQEISPVGQDKVVSVE